MGYACPVCEVPQRDAEHLANHLAFTAMLHADDHEAWLDDRVPEWDELSPPELADRVAPHAPETAYESVFEDTVHDHGGAEHDEPASERGGALFDQTHGGRTIREDHSVPGTDGDRPLDDDEERILKEARRLTEAMLNDEGTDGESVGAEVDGESVEEKVDDDSVEEKVDDGSVEEEVVGGSDDDPADRGAAEDENV